MKASIAVSVVLLSVANAIPLSFSMPFRRQTDLHTVTDKLLFSATMVEFQAARNTKSPPHLDWSSDGCSYSPDEPMGFDFLSSCQRHDFGYRNYKAQSRFTEANKAKLDLNLRSDLYKKCAEEEDRDVEIICKNVANIYYDAVKDFGKKRALELKLEQFEPSQQE